MFKKLIFMAIAFLLSLSSFAQLTSDNVQIKDDFTKVKLNETNKKRSATSPKVCGIDTVEFPRYRGTGNTFFTANVTGGRALGQLYDCPTPLTLSGFTFYAYVSSNPPTAKRMNLICNVYNAGTDSLPSGSPLRSDTLVIDSTFGRGLLSRIEKHASFRPITLNGKYILTIETDSMAMNAGVVTNSYIAGDGRGHNLNCASINGLWYNGRNLNIGNVSFDCDVLLHPHIKYNFGTDFTINSNCYNVADSVKFVNQSPNNMAGSPIYNRYEFFNIGYISHNWNSGVSPFSNFTGVNYGTKYTTKQNYNVRLISRLYGYRGPNFNGCVDTTIKPLYFKPEVPGFSGPLNVCKGDSVRYSANSNDTGIVYEWFKNPQSSPFLIGGSYKINQVLKNDTLYLRANNRGCVSGFRILYIKANDYPSNLTFKDDSICSGSRGILKANTNVGSVLWYNGINDLTPFFTGSVYQTPVLTNNISYYIVASNLGCKLTPRQEIKVNVGSNFAPQPPVVSNDTTVCLSNTNLVVLNASASSGLTTRWFNVGSGGTSFSSTNSINFNPTIREEKVYYVDAFNGVCGSTRVPVTVTVEDFPSVLKVENDVICKGDSARNRVTVAFGKIAWYSESNNGSLLSTNTTYVSKPSNSLSYYIETSSNGCKSINRTRADVTVNEAPSFTKVWADTICAKNKATYTAKINGPGTVSWYEFDTSSNPVFVGNIYVSEVLNGSKRYFSQSEYAGCVGSKVGVQPIVNPAPFSGFSFELQTWQRVKLSPINAGSAGVNWFFGDGNTSKLSFVTHRYQSPGVYDIKLILTNILNGCKDSTTIPVNIETSSLSSVKILPSFQYYPNPSNGFVKIVCSEIMEGGKMMHLLNTSGQVVKSQLLSFENSGAIIDLNGLSNGLYLLKLEGYQSVVISKQE
jgi:hypothetical protein